MAATTPNRAFHAYDPRRALGRLAVAVAIGVVISVLLSSHTWQLRALAGWDVAGLVLAVLAWLVVIKSSAAKTARLAAREDPGRTLVWIIVLIVSLVSMFSAGYVLRISKSEALLEERTLVGLSL
ncbi:MAG: DUF1345 domain-containing protein, partial [Polyangiaceae bacterium]